MPTHLILLVVSFVLLLLAALLDWPRSAPYPYSHTLGWFGLAAFVLAAIVP
jgi:hypothetical protein